MTETVLRVRDHHVEVAVLYVMVSLTGGLAASYCGGVGGPPTKETTDMTLEGAGEG